MKKRTSKKVLTAALYAIIIMVLLVNIALCYLLYQRDGSEIFKFDPAMFPNMF